MGFASIRHIETGGLFCSWFQDGLLHMNIKDCQQMSKDAGYIGSVYDESRNHCCYYNISSTNRHYKHLWKRNEFEDVITSERLCFSGKDRVRLHTSITSLTGITIMIIILYLK